MENAAKALYIAVGILMTIVILSLVVYLYSVFGNYANNTRKELDTTRLVAFNNNFLQYENREDITIHEIISLKNYVIDYDLKLNGFEDLFSRVDYANYIDGTNEYIDVCIKDSSSGAVDAFGGTGSILKKNSGTILEYYINNNDYVLNSRRFKLAESPVISLFTGKVYRIIFEF